MGKIPKYELKEREELELQTSAEKAIAKYTIQKKVNKLSNYRLLQLFIQGDLTKKDLGEIYSGESRSSSWQNLSSNWEIYRKLPNFINLICYVLKVSDDFINHTPNIHVLLGIAYYYDQRINPIESWKPKRKNIINQKTELISHLFVRYEIPHFLYNNFGGCNGSISSSLLVHLGKGLSFKKFDLTSLNVAITQKGYQHLFTIPSDFNFYQGLRWVQIHSLGGDKHLFNAIMQSLLRDEAYVRHDSFWITVIQFFINHPMIDALKIPEIIDYVANQRFGNVGIVMGQRLDANPGDPGFSIKGRTPTSLIRQSDIWHQGLVKTKSVNYRYWDGVKIGDYLDYDSEGKERYKIIQLLNSSDLRDEGANMHHCVGTYAQACATGRSSIFSLRAGGGRILTIECNGKTIVQIRGKHNKRAETWMMNIINNWASKENLTISKWAI